MLRVLRILLTSLSLVLALASTVLWGRSYVWFEGYRRMNVAARDFYQVSSRDGRLWLHRATALPPGFNIASGYFWSSVTVGGVPGPSVFGVLFNRSRPGRWTCGIPYWAIVLVTSAAPAAALAGWVRARRRRRLPGVCRRCGYDMRATPDRCPECGDAPGPVHGFPLRAD